jgi:hypothetical protein
LARTCRFLAFRQFPTTPDSRRFGRVFGRYCKGPIPLSRAPRRLHRFCLGGMASGGLLGSFDCAQVRLCPQCRDFRFMLGDVLLAQPAAQSIGIGDEHVS